MKKHSKSKVSRDMYHWRIVVPERILNLDFGFGETIKFDDHMIPQKAVGFVYIMNYLADDGQMYSYIGKKNFFSKRKKKFGKKKLAAMTDKRAKKYEIVVKPDYKNYFSSNAELKQAYKDGRLIYRTILKICFSKAELTYQETKFQFKHEVLERDEYLNGNILGRFYKGKI